MGLAEKLSEWLLRRRERQEERALLHGLARHGWDGQREVPKETVEKYGLTRDFAGIARLRWDYHLSEKAAHLRADNRASPTASLKRERKEPPGKRQTGETGRRKPPGRRIRM